MKIIIDTNVVISAVFFGGYPRKVIEEVLKNNNCIKFCDKYIPSNKQHIA